MLAVDILPTEFPRESSQHFGQEVIKLAQEMVNTTTKQDFSIQGLDTTLISAPLAEACIAKIDGTLEQGFRYLKKSTNSTDVRKIFNRASIGRPLV